MLPFAEFVHKYSGHVLPRELLASSYLTSDFRVQLNSKRQKTRDPYQMHLKNHTLLKQRFPETDNTHINDRMTAFVNGKPSDRTSSPRSVFGRGSAPAQQESARRRAHATTRLCPCSKSRRTQPPPPNAHPALEAASIHTELPHLRPMHAAPLSRAHHPSSFVWMPCRLQERRCSRRWEEERCNIRSTFETSKYNGYNIRLKEVGTLETCL